MIWTFLWVGWAALFGIIEGAALVREHVFHTDTGSTLSEHFRAWFHTNTKTGRTVWAAVWALFSGLFLAHILGANLTFWG